MASGEALQPGASVSTESDPGEATESLDPRIHGLREIILGELHAIAQDPRWDRSRACVVLSGGLDSSIVAQLGAAPLGLHAAFTVLATPGATDRAHAPVAAAAAGIPGQNHHVIEAPLEELLHGELRTCVAALQTFDPMALRNDLAVCRALRQAAAAGFTCAVTGDAADELFGGYNFTHGLDEQEWLANRQRMAETMCFGSVPLGERFGVHVASPFSRPAAVQAALRFSKADCVGECGGVRLGKLPLRLAFPEVPTRWRSKDPIEVGCGTTELGDRPWLGQQAARGYFHAVVSDAEFEAARDEAQRVQRVTLRDKEHLAYYRVFMEAFPGGDVPGRPRFGSDPCPACGYQLRAPDETFCLTCGHYDPQLRFRHVT